MERSVIPMNGIYDRHLDKNQANYQPLTPLTLLERAATVFPDHIAIIHGDMQITYGQFYSRCRRLASALTALHDEGLLHLDIKPSNIIIGSHPASPPRRSVPPSPLSPTTTTDMPDLIEQAKITDFGLALLSEGERLTLEQTRSKVAAERPRRAVDRYARSIARNDPSADE